MEVEILIIMLQGYSRDDISEAVVGYAIYG